MAQSQQSQPTQPRIDRETFVQLVLNSGLISPDRLGMALQQIATADRAKTVARGLVDKGLLTRFQAERLLVGKTDGFIMGQYRILDELGRGGMGRIFKAEHMTMGRVVALKILSSTLVKTERARQLFHREVKAAALLNHPNIVTAFDANQVGDRCFLVMEFVDGPNLADMVKDHGPLPVAQACDYIRQAAVGLQYAHDIGMVHRDIKPANLLVQRNPAKTGPAASIVKILDFGLARISAPEDGTPDSDSIDTKNKSVMGTPDYLSPEQARNLHAVDGRSDIYSLGCTLYAILTGQVPFPGGTSMEKLVRHSTVEPHRVTALRPDVPPEVAAIVAKMMAKKQEDRYQSAAEVAAALHPFCGKETASWVAVEPLANETVAPVSTKSLPRLQPAQSDGGHWNNLDEDSGEVASTGDVDDLHESGTLSGLGGRTKVAYSSGRRRRNQNAKTDLFWFWTMLAIVGFIAIVGGIVYIVRELMARS